MGARRNCDSGFQNQTWFQKICEAVDCYQDATESVMVSVGKFGIIKLELCHSCALTKFQITGLIVSPIEASNGSSNTNAKNGCLKEGVEL
jgi:hypothetical protein